MANRTAAPRANATKAEWAEFVLAEYGVDVDPDDGVTEAEVKGMKRDDLRELHRIRQAQDSDDLQTLGGDEDPDDEEELKARRAWMADQAPPSLDDVPEELQFSTDTGERRAAEKIAFAMDGMPFWLYRPSDTAMYMFGSQLVSSNASTRLNAMMQLTNLALDDGGVMYLQDRISSRDNSFEDGVIGEIVATILLTWGEKASADKFQQVQQASKGNRQQRRAAERAKAKTKGKSRR
ncbi:tail assembly chaperone [Gordonia phage Lilbeanie]|uniref:Tail assembly chaperone n=1 Tax=Gordonia phage Lilbeanie TaxID=2794947 RepID=A0A7T1KS85_9CAUD|nr:tail assembly chaperone [Gordonia phage Lilbeanie]QPO17104.1 tail assembly chaperone [Gordonia phage Lilbeanie]